MQQSFNELENKPGIYCIENIISGDIYLGSSVRLRDRVMSHFNSLKRGAHQTKFQRAYQKYGGESFVFFSFEYCEDDSDTFLESREQYYMDNLIYAQEYIASNGKDDRFIEMSYNTSPIAGRTTGVIMSGEAIENNRKATTKKWQNKEYREKQMKAREGDWGKKRTEKIRKENPEIFIRQAEIAKKNKNWTSQQKPVLAYDRFTGNFIKEFCSIRDAERKLDICFGSIGCCLKGKVRFVKNMIFKYKDEGDHPLIIEPIPNFYKDPEDRKKVMDKIHKENSAEVISIFRGVTREFASIREASKKTGLSCGKICTSLNGGINRDGYTFKYKDPDYVSKKKSKKKVATLI